MKDTNKLKDLLDRLKGEVRQSSGSGAPLRLEELSVRHSGEPEESAGAAAASRAPRPERFVPRRPEFERPERKQEMGGGVNVIWSENKETMLFGMLASLIAILSGILAALDYVILIGAVSFMLFSFMMALALFGYYLNFRTKTSDGGGMMSERVDQLARRLEALSAKNLTGQQPGPAGARPQDRDLEQKVDELRILVKALARAVEQQGGDKL